MAPVVSIVLLRGPSPGLIPATCAVGLPNVRSQRHRLSLPWVGIQAVGDSASYGTFKALPVESDRLKGRPWALRSEPPAPGRGRMVARLESSGRRWWPLLWGNIGYTRPI